MLIMLHFRRVLLLIPIAVMLILLHLKRVPFLIPFFAKNGTENGIFTLKFQY